jgi:hypothetical protein
LATALVVVLVGVLAAALAAGLADFLAVMSILGQQKENHAQAG